MMTFDEVLPYSRAATLIVATMTHQVRREGKSVQEKAEPTLTLSTEYGFPYWLAFASFMRGWALAEQGDLKEGTDLMHRGLAAWQEIGSEVFRPYLLALLAEVYGKMERPEKGLNAIEEATIIVNRNGERHYEAELCRLKGELTLQKLSVISSQLSVPNPQLLTPSTQAEAEQDAEEYFRKAIDIAQKQQAKSLELRATVSLARLWQQQGNQHEAHKMLSKVYNWFTEGFDTKDLQEAKVLLEELSP